MGRAESIAIAKAVVRLHEQEKGGDEEQLRYEQQRYERILRAYNEGRTVSEMAEEFDIPVLRVEHIVEVACSRRVKLDPRMHRLAQNQLLDDQLALLVEQERAVGQLIQLGIERQNPEVIENGLIQRNRVIETRMRIAERRAKLNGLDKPVQVETTVLHTSVVDEAVALLTEQMGVVPPAAVPDEPPVDKSTRRPPDGPPALAAAPCTPD